VLFNSQKCATYHWDSAGQPILVFQNLRRASLLPWARTLLYLRAVLQALKPLLEPWFTTVATDPQLFQISGLHFLPLYDAHFPDIVSGTWLNSAPDPEAFSPVLDMLNGFVWRLWCNRILTSATVMNRTFLKNYLSIGQSAVTTTTYLGAAIPGRFCPKFAYHFKIDRWPTDLADTTNTGFLSKFELLPMIL
jgi:hypothetical protein